MNNEFGTTRRLGATYLFFLLSVLFQTELVFGASIEVGPSDPWCSTINAAAPGQEVVLLPGSYASPCWITARGVSGAPIVVRSQSEEPSLRAAFTYSGSTSNVLEIRDAAYVTLRGFAFGPTQDGVDAIRIRRANDIVIERNIFQAIGGVSIPANDGNTQRLTVRQNTFKDLKYTGLYFGCQDGTTCQSSALLIEGNLIDGVTTPFDESAIGYGLEIKLNSYGVVRDNTIYRTKGPGIMVYGSNRDDPASVLEGNYVEGSRTEGGIVVGGGPAIVRNNVLVGNAYGGISAQNYASRNLQQNVWIVNNTAFNNSDSGINVAGWTAGANNVIAYNAILPQGGTPATRPSSPSGTIVGNVVCGSAAVCFVNAATAPYDLWPVPAGPLFDAVGFGTESWRPVDDFMGILRGSSADVGAFERSSVAIDHLVGGGTARPSRVSTNVTLPTAPIDLKAE